MHNFIYFGHEHGDPGEGTKNQMQGVGSFGNGSEARCNWRHKGKKKLLEFQGWGTSVHTSLERLGLAANGGSRPEAVRGAGVDRKGKDGW